MEKASLKQYFSGVVAKRLSEVEVVPSKSNQREFNATSAMKAMLGTERKTYATHFVYLSDVMDPVTEEAFLTWYDARENNPTRSEYRLFYKKTLISEQARVGDCLFLCRRYDETLLAVVTEKDSMMENRLNWLFGIRPANLFEAGNLEANDREYQMIVDCLLQMIGVEVRQDSEELEKNLRILYEKKSPRLADLCDIACRRSGIPADGDADEAVMVWMYCLNELVCAIKNYMLEMPDSALYKKLSGNWQDEALRFFFRMILRARNIRFDEYKNTGIQYLIMPGFKEFSTGQYPNGRLTEVKFACMLESVSYGVYTVDMPYVHLITMDPGITEEQRVIQKSKKVQFVIPRPVQTMYNNLNTFWFLSVEELLLLLKEKQEGRYGN